MASLQAHVRNKLVAGALAAIPVAVTFFILWYVDSRARSVLGLDVPFVGIALAIGTIYLLGVFVTSVLGQEVLGLADRVLQAVPGLRDLYRNWKQIAVNDGHDGTIGMFTHVVLVPDQGGRGCVLGFTSGHAIDGDPGVWCVFIPASPNPTSGRLTFVPAFRCIRLDLPPREALKVFISGGNYIPPAIGAATAERFQF